MKNEKKQFAGKHIYDGGSHLPRQLNSLNKIYNSLLYDDDKESLYSLYHIYVYVLCSFIESLLRSTYESVLINQWNENINTQHRNLIRIAQEKLNSLNWESLKKDTETYLSCSFPNNVSGSKEMKAINMMFDLRNKLIHGNNFEKIFYANEDNKINFEVSGNANRIYSYFIEQKLITQDKIEFLNHFELNSQIIKHFLNCTNTFTKNYCNFIKSIVNFDYNSIYKEIEVPISKFQPIEKEL